MRSCIQKECAVGVVIDCHDNIADGPSRFREPGALSEVRALNMTFAEPYFPETKLIELLSEMASNQQKLQI